MRPVSSCITRRIVTSGAPTGRPSSAASAAVGGDGAEPLHGRVRAHPAVAEQRVQATPLEVVGGDRAGDVDEQPVAQDRERLRRRTRTRSRSMCTTSVPTAHAERVGDVVVGGDAVERHHRGDRLTADGGEVVEQARQLERTPHLIVDDLRADAAPAHEHAGVDEVLDGSPHRGARHLPAVGEVELVVEERSLREQPGLDRHQELARELVVERHRADPVEGDLEVGHGDRQYVTTFDGLSTCPQSRLTGPQAARSR